MYIFYLFEAVFISHVLTLGKKGLECGRVLATFIVVLTYWCRKIWQNVSP
jgi:hypothetical protein